MIRAAATCLLVVATTLVAPPAAAAPALAPLPDVVRVNIAGLGTTYAVLSSTGTMTVTRPDGSLVYQGGARTLVRRNVRRVTSDGIVLPDLRVPAAAEERMDRAALLREARRADREGTRAIVTTPFELSLVASAAEDFGTPLVQSDRILRLRFVTADGFLTYDGRAFRGELELAPDDEGDLIVVNTVSTHDYLVSVVGSEEPAAWEPEALMAQAVAARTYLSTHLRRHGSYDLEGDTRDQQYDGVGSEAPSTTRAVERTAGLIATYRGAPIEALYSANAGGVTEDSENVYANALPYLRSVPSPGDEVASRSSWGHTSWQWTKEITAPQLRDYLLVRGVDVGEPTGIDLTRVSPTGRVLAARIVGTTAQRDIGKDSSRYYFGLRSSLFTVAQEPGGTLEPVEFTNIERATALRVLGAEVVGEVYRRVVGSGNELEELRAFATVHKMPARFLFSGKGFGHGVGMSQWGAQGMALGGATMEEILAHYYRGTALTKIGGA